MLKTYTQREKSILIPLKMNWEKQCSPQIKLTGTPSGWGQAKSIMGRCAGCIWLLAVCALACPSLTQLIPLYMDWVLAEEQHTYLVTFINMKCCQVFSLLISWFWEVLLSCLKG